MINSSLEIFKDVGDDSVFCIVMEFLFQKRYTQDIFIKGKENWDSSAHQIVRESIFAYLQTDLMRIKKKAISIVHWPLILERNLIATKQNLGQEHLAMDCTNFIEHLNANDDNICLVVEEEGNGEYLSIVKFNPEESVVTVIGQIPFFCCPSVIDCNNSIFCFGGFNFDARVVEYRPTFNNCWTPTHLIEPVVLNASAASTNEIMLSGGGDWNAEIASCRLYSQASSSWINLPMLQQARSSHGMCWFPDGCVLVIGGISGGKYLSSAEMMFRSWTPTTNHSAPSSSWRNVASMRTARRLFGCTTVERSVVVAGGLTVGHLATSSVEIYRPPNLTTIHDFGQWTSLTDLSAPIDDCYLIYMPAGLIIIGWDGKMQRGMKKTKLAAGDLDQWIWTQGDKLKSVFCCRGLVKLTGICGSTFDHNR